MPTPQPSPELGLPASTNTVRVSIIDPGSAVSNVRTTTFVEPELPGFSHHPTLPAYAFLVEHPSGEKHIFDLSIRKDWKNLTPATVDKLQSWEWVVETKASVSEVLTDAGVELDAINGIIWSHWHWDHTGDPSLFPTTTDLIVGPGFKDKFVPGYPTKPESGVDESAWQDRRLQELAFDGNLTIGGLAAIDLYKDGSFYILDAPGHAIGHLMGLARTTPTTFILMGADTCHHPGLFRPSPYHPLPDHVDPSTSSAQSLSSVFPCPGSLLLSKIHPEPNKDPGITPFYTFPNIPDGTGVSHNRAQAVDTAHALLEFDASDDVFVVIAHDASIVGTVDVLGPNGAGERGSANAWQEKGWKERTRWAFVRDFEKGLQES